MQKKVSPYERVKLARNAKRPGSDDFIAALFEDFFEIRGDRAYSDDNAVICGIARFNGAPVSVAAICKGRTIEARIKRNFGMAQPDGYRKFLRCLAQAVKFRRPLITFIDTPGAYPGKSAEERGQGQAIAECLYQMSAAPIPIISIVIGEGGSGGAIALGVADRLIMLENAVLSVLSPEGFASILWKDSARAAEASDVMKLTAADLLEYKIADYLIQEPDGGAGEAPELVINRVGELIKSELTELLKLSETQLLNDRYRKYRLIGTSDGEVCLD
ncbi:MAG: acetyl-CoA carboxylase carboxyl transferase subunit alpha [Oscillospiraceae bacterium]|jgi:acetyl-CoA carboxylase carboxyl transferase subunit alpha|nr:acetyl-CoA carboxylase carboxyl transferase subunit alpha [Oscillospiraceae bacterium]